MNVTDAGVKRGGRIKTHCSPNSGGALERSITCSEQRGIGSAGPDLPWILRSL